MGSDTQTEFFEPGGRCGQRASRLVLAPFAPPSAAARASDSAPSGRSGAAASAKSSGAAGASPALYGVFRVSIHQRDTDTAPEGPQQQQQSQQQPPHQPDAPPTAAADARAAATAAAAGRASRPAARRPPSPQRRGPVPAASVHGWQHQQQGRWFCYEQALGAAAPGSLAELQPFPRKQRQHSQQPRGPRAAAAAAAVAAAAAAAASNSAALLERLRAVRRGAMTAAAPPPQQEQQQPCCGDLPSRPCLPSALAPPPPPPPGFGPCTRDPLNGRAAPSTNPGKRAAAPPPPPRLPLQAGWQQRPAAGAGCESSAASEHSWPQSCSIMPVDDDDKAAAEDDANNACSNLVRPSFLAARPKARCRCHAPCCACGGAAAAAARSVSARLLCAEVSVYTDASSPEALAAANDIMARIWLPGGVTYEPVSLGSAEFQMGVMWQFPAFAVALGASYFRRLLAAKPHLALAARRCPAFGAYCCGAQPPPLPPPPPAEGNAMEVTLRSAQFTCIFLATKVADQVHAHGLLRFMLGALCGARHAVHPDQASEVELRCLEGLNWRLGPYFSEDPMGGDDADLAAAFRGGGCGAGAY